MPFDYNGRMGLQLKRTNPNFIKTSTVIKLNPFLGFFTRPSYLRISTVFAALQILVNAYLTKKNACDASSTKTVFVIFQHCLSVAFTFETIVSIWIIYHNSNMDSRFQLNARIPFNWFEFGLLLCNISSGVMITFDWCPKNVWLSIPFLGCSLSAGRLLRRVRYFRRAVSIIWNSALSLLVSSIFIIQFILVFSTIATNLFSNSVLTCNKEAFVESPLNPSECAKEGGSMSLYFINYNNFWETLFTCYAIIDKSQWFMTTDLVTMNWKGNLIYNIWHYVFVIFGAAIVSLYFRATTISLCYINLGAFSLVNIDKTITLSEQQREWVQIEEQLASIQLFRKKEKSFHYFVVICRNICNSRISKAIYNTILIGGFVLNLAAYNDQPEGLKVTQFIMNLVVISIVNLQLVLEMHADSWQDVWYDSDKKQRIMMVVFTDLIVLITQAVGILKEISFQVIYVQIFMVIRDLASSLSSSKSRLMQIYEMFITQIYSYISAIAFVFFMTAIFAFEITFLVDDTLDSNRLSGEETAGYLMIWIYDNSWIRSLDVFVRAYKLKSQSVGIVALVIIYLVHFIYKNIIHRMFISVVVDGYQRVQEMNSFVFGKEEIDLLLKHWMKYDPAAKGLISAKDYFEFLMNLPPPLRLSLEQLLMRADVDPQDFISYSSRKVFKRSFDNDLCLTVRQFYELLNVYNLPVYIYDGKTYVHFRDVAKLLTKIAIENKFGNSESLWDMTDKLKLALKDLWYARYPQLVELKESFHQISVDTIGTRMKGFDTKMYQAAETMREIYQIRKRQSEAKRVLTNYALKIIHTDGQDDVNKDRYKDRLTAMMRDEAILSSKRMFHHILSDYQKKKTLGTRTNRHTHEGSVSQDLQSQTARFATKGEEFSEPFRLPHHKSHFSQGPLLNERLVQTAENSRATMIEFPIPRLKFTIKKPVDPLKKSESPKKLRTSGSHELSMRKSKKRKDLSFQNSNGDQPYPLEPIENSPPKAEVLQDIKCFEQIGLHNFLHKLRNTENGVQNSYSSSHNQDSSEDDEGEGEKNQQKIPPMIFIKPADSPRNHGNLSRNESTPPAPRSLQIRKNKSFTDHLS